MTDDEPKITGYEWSFRCECGGEIANDSGYLERWKDGEYESFSSIDDARGPITDDDTYTCPFCGRTYTVSIEEQ